MEIMNITDQISRLAFKRKTLQKAKEKQLDLIEDFKNRIDDIKSSEVVINEEPLDHDQGASNETGIRMIDKLADQLNFAIEEMDFLNKMRLSEEPLDRVALGSIVETNQETFFPSVSIERFEVEGRSLFGLSDKAPLYKLMKDKQVGDSWTHQGKEYKILEIY